MGKKRTTTAKDEERESERVIRDLQPLEGESRDIVGGARSAAGSGGCPELACGSGGNHNEVLAVTP